MKTSRSIRLLALLLTVVLTLTSLPLLAFAAGESGGGEVPSATAEGDAAGTEGGGDEVSCLFELPDKRDALTKHYYMSDGSYRAVVYDNPVHYLDEAEVWQEIDNTISEQYSLFSGRTIAGGRGGFSATFADRADGLLTLTYGGYTLSFAPEGAARQSRAAVAELARTSGTDRSLEAVSTLDHLTGRVRYPDALPGADLEYVLQGNRFLENIIVKERAEHYAYRFTLHTNGLTPLLEADGDILLLDPAKGEAVFCIPASYMFDAAGRYATEVFYLLEQTGKDVYRLSILPDVEWMNDPDRVFPVTIDPPVYIVAPSRVTDLYIDSYHPHTTFDTTTLVVGWDGWDSPMREYQSFWKANTLPDIGKNSVLTYASFSFRIWGVSCFPSLGIYPVLSEWDETLTWDKAHGSGTLLLADDFEGCASFSDNAAYPTQHSFNITRVARQWYSGELANHGICLKSPWKGLLETGNYCQGIDIESSTNGAYRPTLTLIYIDMTGIEDYFSLSAHAAGRAGWGISTTLRAS